MLHSCPECKNSVSDVAPTCPQCGYRLLGREHLVPCPHCRADVLPEVHPHDTVSRYCPICNRPVTNLPGRRTLFTISGIFGLIFVGVTALILYAFFRLSNSMWP